MTDVLQLGFVQLKPSQNDTKESILVRASEIEAIEIFKYGENGEDVDYRLVLQVNRRAIYTLTTLEDLLNQLASIYIPAPVPEIGGFHSR